MYILGVTGGIATGKSSVLGVFAALGAPTTSADTIARDLLSPGSSLTNAVLEVFPECRLLDETGLAAVNRPALAKIIFANPDSRKKLESLTHPPIVAALRLFIDNCRARSEKVAAVEIPLLYESGLRNLVDGVLVVSCSNETQIERLKERQNLTTKEAEAWIGAQWPLEKKRSLAEYVVDNDGDFKDTERQIQSLWNGF